MKTNTNTQYTKPAHGTIVTFADNGNKALFLDNGTFKGLYVTPRTAKCVIENLTAIQLFAGANPVTEKPKAAAKAKAPAVKTPAQETVEAELARIRAIVANLEASRSGAPAAPIATETGRLDPAAPVAQATA